MAASIVSIDSIGTVLIESTIIHEYINSFKIVEVEITYNNNNKDDIIIEPTPLFEDHFTIIMGPDDTLRFQHMTSTIGDKYDIMNPCGTIICKYNKGDTIRTSSMVSREKINHLSNIRFPKGNSILVLGNDTLDDFNSCYLYATKRTFLLFDLRKMIATHDTKKDVILIISDELLNMIKHLSIDLTIYFKQIISFPANKLLDCVDEMINGKIIKTNEEKTDITINIGENNTILSSVFQPDINITTLIGTKGRIRFMSNSTIFSTTFIIVVRLNDPLIFQCDTEHIDLILNTTTLQITNRHLNNDNLLAIIELSIDNDNLLQKISDDILSDLLVKYLINNSMLVMFKSLFDDKNDDIILRLIKQLILTINQSNVSLLNQLITNGKNRMIQFYNTTDSISTTTNIPVINRYSSVPYHY